MGQLVADGVGFRLVASVKNPTISNNPSLFRQDGFVSVSYMPWIVLFGTAPVVFRSYFYILRYFFTGCLKITGPERL